jgi:hypothetical protein
MSQIDPKTIGSQTSQTSAPFFLLGPGGTTLTIVKINVNQKIDFLMKPTVDNADTVYAYSTTLSDPIYYLSGSASINQVYFRGIYQKLSAPPPGTSGGGNYVSPSGVVVALPPGNAIPAGWVLYVPGSYLFVSGTKIKQVKVGDKQDINGYYPVNDGNYQISALSQSGTSADVFVVTKGEQVTGVNVCYLIGFTGPAEPPPAAPVAPNSSTLGIAPDPTASDPYSDAPAIPVGYVGPVAKPDPYAPIVPQEKASSGMGDALLLVGKIIGAVGLAGVGYTGYLILTNPEGAKVFLQRFTDLKGLIVDSMQLLLAFGIIAAIGFVSYEFTVAYNETGSVPGALASMGADAVEGFVKILVETIEDLVVDLGHWIGSEVDKLSNAIENIF